MGRQARRSPHHRRDRCPVRFSPCWAQRISEQRRELKRRKLFVFKELMATRAAKVSPRHVEALNAIEIEFSSGRGSDKKVADAWRLYLDHLNDTVDPNDSGALTQWGKKGDDLLTDLLYEMSQALQFEFDKVALKKGIYSPKAHGEMEIDQYMLRKYLVELMAGKRAIWSGIFTGDKPVRMEVTNLTDIGAPPPDVVVEKTTNRS
ncbi:MAG TPA: DUF6680 family protein [Vicinamibacterales bacterium]|nr:DUF6680 family protein [Vicinamibacterales bacterium]